MRESRRAQAEADRRAAAQLTQSLADRGIVLACSAYGCDPSAVVGAAALASACPVIMNCVTTGGGRTSNTVREFTQTIVGETVRIVLPGFLLDLGIGLGVDLGTSGGRPTIGLAPEVSVGTIEAFYLYRVLIQDGYRSVITTTYDQWCSQPGCAGYSNTYTETTTFPDYSLPPIPIGPVREEWRWEPVAPRVRDTD
jgi:hypothetical protein